MASTANNNNNNNNNNHTARTRASSTSSVATSFSSSSSARLLSAWRDHEPSAQTQAIRAVSLIASIVSALCGGSITVFSLYGHIFQERLRYTQFQLNGLAIAGSLALYLPVSVLGYVCDRVGTAPLSALAAVAFSGGYGLAATIYRKLDLEYSRQGPSVVVAVRESWSYPLMVFAFVCIGVGTCSMYLSAVATCAKNFGKGRHRGLALATPIAAFGLSGMWISQIGSRVFYEVLPDGRAGDVDVFRFFVFLAILLFIVGVLGIFALRVVGEHEMIEEADEELERSGLLDGGSGVLSRSYGAIDEAVVVSSSTGIVDEDHDDKWKKNSVLDAETKQFLSDPTMWLLALGFVFVTGPSEAFQNNLGTLIGTLSPPGATDIPATTAATHVSILAISSTVARLAVGTLTDMLAPSPDTQHPQFLSSDHPSLLRTRRFAISRIAFLISSALILSVGLVVLASGAVQNHPDRLWIVSGLVGAGYGAVFSLTPIAITVIWGVENFATNWGIVAMFPALGATVGGLVYSAVYQREANNGGGGGGDHDGDNEIFCYGKSCYSSTFWFMAVTVWIASAVFLWAWRGRGGWKERGIVI
jgi:MFS family permease